MPYQDVKLYQTGTYAVGGRLLDPEKRSVQARTERSNTLTCGHRACQACGEALGARFALDSAMRATKGKLIAANATGCLEVFLHPLSGELVEPPWIHSLFGNAPAVSTGIAAALKAKGLVIRVVGQGGRRRHPRPGFGPPIGDVRAKRRRAVHLLRQRGRPRILRRPALGRDSARRADRQHQAGLHGAGQRLRAGQERSADRDGARDPLRRHRHGLQLRDLEYKVEKAMEMRGARYLHMFYLAPWDGDRHRRTRSRSRGSPRETGIFPCSKGRGRRGRRRLEDPQAGAGHRIPEAGEALRAPLQGPATHRRDRGDPGPGRARSGASH